MPQRIRGFVLMLAGECPLFSAWGRFEDGAPAPHEHLRRGGVRTVNDEPRGAKQDAMPY